MSVVLTPVTSPEAGSLITQAEAELALPALTAAQVLDLPAAITAATRSIEHYCRRPLVLGPFDKVYRPGRTRRIYLPTWPVVSLQLRADLVVAATITNADTGTNQQATVTPTATALAFSRTASGVVTTNHLALAGYATMTLLGAAVNALGGGWTATVGSDLASYAVADLNLDPGTVGALGQAVELRTYRRPLSRYNLDGGHGVVELTENLPTSFRYPDRAWGAGFGFSWSSASEPRHAGVRATGRAGYAVETDDLAAGYEPVPDDLKRATIMSVQGILDATSTPNLQSESDGAYSYTMAGALMALPKGVQSILLAGGYVSPRIAR